MKRFLATALCGALLVVGGATTASADDAPPISPLSLCSGSNIIYKTSNASTTFTQASQSNSSVTGGPGVTLAISTSATFTVSGTISSSVDVTASTVVASVKSSLGVSITTSKSGTTTNSGSWVVPLDYEIGRLAIGSMKYKGTVTKYLENSNCVQVQQGTSAAYNAPVNEWHFQHTKVA